MKVRFDESKVWRTANGCTIAIADMETAHLMNTLRMFIAKPNVVMSMIAADIDNFDEDLYYGGVWQPTSSSAPHIKKESMWSATSMSAEELTSYAIESALGQAMRNELAARGVNVDNLLIMWKTEVTNNEQQIENV